MLEKNSGYQQKEYKSIQKIIYATSELLLLSLHVLDRIASTIVRVFQQLASPKFFLMNVGGKSIIVRNISRKKHEIVRKCS